MSAFFSKVIDGWHSISYYWVGKSPAAALFSGPPGGPFGMDHTDYLGWMWEGGGHDLWIELYQKELKLNVHWLPILPSGPQAFGWFKRPIKNLADFKGMKCRQTGINAEVFQRMGMATVNMPGGEIVPAAQRGVIDCAEWVGGVEDLRLGLHQVHLAALGEHGHREVAEAARAAGVPVLHGVVEGRDVAGISQLTGRVSSMTIARVGFSLSREAREDSGAAMEAVKDVEKRRV